MADLKFLADEWPAISRRLDEALALAPGQRGPWLGSLSESESIKGKLRQLLSSPEGVETDDFVWTLPRLDFEPDGLAQAGGTDAGQPADAECAGAVIGPYRLIRELGVGGMGLVWLAERVDGGLKRQVALKLPRLNGSRGLAERLRRERDILASLDHPNIARIHDAGVDAQGRPYLALEYIEGEPIDAYCRARASSVAQRLALVLQVAHAVAHAHARLVVHRDLKPANILVTATGQVRLLDFGIAKLMEGELTADTQLTQQVGRALTLDYASPEQIRGEPIGTASDVYSLGVVAYELLAQAKPYQLKRQSVAALEEAIDSVDVRLASSAAADAGARRALAGDLDAILNKALKKTVAERYPTVDALAQDIERHLAHLPVQARPDALGYRARQFVRRNKLALAAATAVSVSLIAGVSLASWQARLAIAQADRAERVKAFVLSIFDDADSDTEAGTSGTAADLLRQARQRVSSETGGGPEVAVELMTAIALSMIGQGLMADAATLMHDAVEASTRQLGPRHALTAAAQLVHGEALVELGRNPEALAALMPSVDTARRAGDPRTLNSGLRWLATAQANSGNVAASLEFARQAVASLSARRDSGMPLTARATMLTYQSLMQALEAANQPGAVEAGRLALAAAHEVYGQKVTTPVLTIRTLLARAQVSEGQIEDGLRELDALVLATAELLGPRHPRVSKLAYLAGSAKLDAGDVPGTISAFRQSLAIEDLQSGADSTFDRGMIRFFLGSAYAAARNPAVALPLLDEAVKLIGAGAGPGSPRTLRALSVQAWQLAEAGQLVESEAAFAALETAAWSDVDRAAHQGRLAVLRGLQGRHADAIELATAASAFVAQRPRKEPQARALSLLGQAHLDGGDATRALQALQQAQSLFAQVQPGISPDHAQALVALGRTQMQLRDPQAALLSLSAADRFWQAYAPSGRHAGLAKLYLAQAWWAQGDRRAAVQALSLAQPLLVASGRAADRALLQSTQQRFGS
ncbi:MAG: protein kinase [Rubrivivax sp.]|nr:protein kinase [Rubrivivax sp.]